MTFRLRARAVPVLLAVVAVVAASSCYSPTEITLEVTTDTACDGTASTTAIVVGPRGGVETAAPNVETGACQNKSFGTLVVVPRGDRGAQMTIKVVMGVGKAASTCAPPSYTNCIVARRTMRFIKHTSLRLPIVMSAACLGVPCTDETTCVEGMCMSAVIDDSTECAGAGCTEDVLFPNHPPPPHDGGMPVDAAKPDARDASGIDAADAGDSAGDAGPDCGPDTCAPNEYCEIHMGGVFMDGSTNTTYGCVPFPQACPPKPTCACIASTAACTCDDQDGPLSVTCRAP